MRNSTHEGVSGRSFLIYLNTMTEGKREKVDNLLVRLLNETLFTNMLILDETVYVSEGKFGVPYDVTLDFFQKIMLPHTEIIPIDEEDISPMQKYLITYRLRPSDAIHLATMEKTGVSRIVTEDEDFDRVKGIVRLWLESPNF